jgi:hypothetical protein
MPEPKTFFFLAVSLAMVFCAYVSTYPKI